MQEVFRQEALQALHEQDYKKAADILAHPHLFPDDENQVREIYQTVNELNNNTPDPDLCTILGYIALDYNDVFNPDRQEALIQCVQWGKQGLTIDPNHYGCIRQTGSALYWLDDTQAATKYYEKASQIIPSPSLQIRLFNLQVQSEQHPDFSLLRPDLNTDNAMEAYNSGVEINSILRVHTQMPETERVRMSILKKQCYELSYQLFKTSLTQGNNYKNYDPHTFAMCCNNLSTIARDNGEWQKAVALTTEGMEHSYFMVILTNRFGAYCDGNQNAEAVKDGTILLNDFESEMDFYTYFNTVEMVSYCYMELKEYAQALEFINEGLDSYYAMDPADPILTNEEVVRCFTNFFINKSKAEEALGIKPDAAVRAGEMDEILEDMPDNPSVLISRGMEFAGSGEYQKAQECYQYAIHFASEQGKGRSVQVAFYNLGYMQEVQLRDTASALVSFEQSIANGNTDFWCYYWATHCSYHLQENEKTVEHASMALEALRQQEGVADDIIAEVYEHLGTAQIDLGMNEEAAGNLKISLKYHDHPDTRKNLVLVSKEKKGGFFKGLFGG